MITKILVPTDGSVFSRKASKLAIDIAKAAGAEVVAVHVIEVKPPKLLEGADIEKLKSKQADVCFRDFEEEAKKSGVAFDSRMLVSRSVSKTIIEYIDAESPDIVVMGSKGLTGLKKIMMGSVTTAVLEKTAVPLLVVK
ncbi:MAG: universal stress protein [Candidatus Aenigmarchaeota archaeon]|nr:universal stress protein [Candidatus Aenigmarchaeota archaeon]